MPSVVNSAIHFTAASATGTVTLTVGTSGNAIAVMVFRDGSGPNFVNSITGPAASWTSAQGTIGNSNVEIRPGASTYYMSAFVGYANATGSQTITIGIPTGTVNFYIYACELSGVATSSAILSSIGIHNATAGPGTDAINVTGGTGSDSVPVAPSIALVAVRSSGTGTLAAGTGFSQQQYNNANRQLLESSPISSSGTFDGTASVLTASCNAFAYQLVLAGQGSSGYGIAEVINGSFSGGSGSQVMTTNCNVGDLILVITEPSNVAGLVNVPVNDTVNTGNYAPVASFYPGSGTNCMNIVFMACNQSGQPTIQWGNTGTYSNAIFQIIRATGFPSAPILDVASVVQATATGTAISNSTTLAQSNELAFSINLYGQPISFGSQNAGWSDTGVGTQGSLRNEFFQAGITGAKTFTATASSSGTWYNYLFGFYSGVTIPGAQGSFTLTGQTANFILGQITTGSAFMLASPGAFDWVGAQSQSPAIMQGGFGPFFMTGQNANLISSTGAAFTLTAATGFFTMTGIDAVLQGSVYVFSAFTGFFTMTGFAANLVSTGPGGLPIGDTLTPNLIGLDWLTASAVLYFGGFAEINPSIVKVTNQNEGIVVGQTPAPFTQVPIGCTVQLTVGSDHLLAVSFEAI